MKYLLLIHHGDAPTPREPDRWNELPEDEQRRIYEAWGEIANTPGVQPGMRLEPPEMATTVRVANGETLTTDGPYVAVKEAVGGFLVFEADDLDAAIELAARIPSTQMGGAVEVRPVYEG